MKKRNKINIAMMLALAFMLCISAPAAGVFAAEQLESSQTGSSINYVESLAELFDRVQHSKAFDDYRDREDFLIGMLTFETLLLSPTEDVFKQSDHDSSALENETWYNQLADSTKAIIQQYENYPIVALLDVLKADPLYEKDVSYQNAVNTLELYLNTALVQVISQLQKDYPDDESLKSDTVNVGEILDLAENTKDFWTYLNLYNAERQLNTYSTKDGTHKLDEKAIQQDFTQTQLAALWEIYSEMSKEIEPSILSDLPIYADSSSPSSVNINAFVNPSISIDAVSGMTGEVSYNRVLEGNITATVSANTSYQVLLSAAEPSLKDSTQPTTAGIPPIATASSTTDSPITKGTDAWGIYSGNLGDRPGTDLNPRTYSPITTTPKPYYSIATSSTTLLGGTEHSFGVAIAVSLNIPYGTYSTSVTVTAVNN